MEQVGAELTTRSCSRAVCISLPYMDALLKRREELLKAKQEIEKKLKSAAKVKNNKIALTENEAETENACIENIVKSGECIEDTEQEMDYSILERDTIVLPNTTTLITLAWDIEGKLLAVLTDSKVLLKSFNPSHPFPKRIIDLPHRAGKETKFMVSSGLMGLSFADGQNYIYSKDKWNAVDSGGRLIWLHGKLILSYNEKLKMIIVLCCESFKKIGEIEDVERFNYNNNENPEIILLEKIDGSLTI